MPSSYPRVVTLFSSESVTLLPPPPEAPPVGDWYVSTDGDDGGTGAWNDPFLTIAHGISVTDPGQVLVILPGTFHEKVTANRDGNASNPITINGYGAILDGTGVSVPSGQSLLTVTGDYVHVNGLEITASGDVGFSFSAAATYGVVAYCEVHDNTGSGIQMHGDYGIAEYNNIYANSLANYHGGGGTNGSGISSARTPTGCIIRHNHVHGNWGEGASTFESYDCVIEDNVIHDNWTVNLYLSDTVNPVAQRNIIYTSTDSPTDGWGSGLGIGILIGNETADPPLSNITVLNNLVVRCHRNFAPGAEAWVDDGIVAYNTLVNAHGDYNCLFYGGVAEAGRFKDNIILQEDSVPIAILGTTGALVFSYNCWSKLPPVGCREGHDVNADPKVEKTGEVTYGNLTSAYFLLAEDSPCIGAGIPITETASDYFESPRDDENPTMGGVEG